MNEGFLGILRLAAVAIQNLGFAVVVGALFGSRWLARGDAAWQAVAGRRMVVALRAAAVGALLASVVAFWAHCALMSDATLLTVGPAVWPMLTGTGFGHAWLAGALGMGAVVALSFRWRGGGDREPVALWLAIAGVALARSHGGHPVEAGWFSLPVWIDWLHLLAISTWVGIVLVTAGVVMPRLLDAPRGEAPAGAAFVQSLSDAATAALVVLFGTGAYNGWRGVNTSADLLGSAYGQVLLVKLALVLLAAALGGHNRLFGMPKLLKALSRASAVMPCGPLRHFNVVLCIESVVLAGVLAAAAVLASSPLPGTM
ncbi:CopD family protein [Burkholderia stagnalis]|uniref:CopD family protein n=1 Tax=Burkholderia stagnalis TaxID=1503054 RepID=UPI000F80BBEB|nr:CopD family protein [Burkholderia stagnalis]